MELLEYITLVLVVQLGVVSTIQARDDGTIPSWYDPIDVKAFAIALKAWLLLLYILHLLLGRA